MRVGSEHRLLLLLSLLGLLVLMLLLHECALLQHGALLLQHVHRRLREEAPHVSAGVAPGVGVLHRSHPRGGRAAVRHRKERLVLLRKVSG